MLKKDNVKIRLSYIINADRVLKDDYFKYTLPIVGNELVWGLGFTMYSVIMGHLGSDAAAANSIANIIKNLSVCVCMGIGSASGVIIGSELGRGNLEKAKKYGSKLCKISIIGGAISGAVILCIIPFIHLFSSLKCSQFTLLLNRNNSVSFSLISQPARTGFCS